MKIKTILIAVAALVVVAAIGVAALVLRDGSTAEVLANETSVEKKVVKNAPVKKTSAPARAKPAEASPVKEAKPKSAHQVAGEKAIEKSADADAEKKAEVDNPFPRYLDMFKNNPEALAAEFEKEAEVDRAAQRKMRDDAIAMLKLNADQAAIFEKALDDIRNAVLQQEQEKADLITSGQLNMETAADGSLWSSNELLMDQFIEARQKVVRDAAVELYNQLEVDGVSDAEKQKIIRWATYRTSFSYDCCEPLLQVYDKIYKNMGFGNGIFSWCVRPRQKK